LYVIPYSQDTNWLPTAEKKSATSASVAMVHSIPELIVSEEVGYQYMLPGELRCMLHWTGLSQGSSGLLNAMHINV
jgi:hypothetical protein